jgi:hypothetical protein
MNPMATAETKAYLETLVAKVAEELISIHPRSNQASEYGLRFPRKRDGSLRISEQESKHLLAQHIRADRRFCYSVETPTTQTYRQKGNSDMSARVDLSLVDHSGQPCVNIELKAHYCAVENIRKDLEKLVRENTTGVWFHTLEKGDPGRVETLFGTFRMAFRQLSAHLGASETSYLISICSVEAGMLYSRWLTLRGNLDENLAEIDSIFREGSLSSDAWHVIRFSTDSREKETDGVIRLETPSTLFKGKGAREGFFIYAPTIANDTYMHLSGRGGSYRIRNFHNSKGPTSPGFVILGYPTLESLRAGGVVTKWFSVTAEDSRHNVIEQPKYWQERIRQINRQALPNEDDPFSTIGST